MKWWPWLLGGGVAALVLTQRGGGGKKDEPLTAPEIDNLMAAAYADAAFNAMVGTLARTGGATIEDIKRRRTGPFEVVLSLRVSGFEKMFAGDITEDARKAAVKAAEQLASACPGAPALAKLQPSVLRVSDTSSGFRVRIVWPALWGSDAKGPVRDQVRACIERRVKAADKELGSRLTKLTARRLG